MKYFLGFSAGVLMMIILNVLNEYVLRFEIPQFLIGWLSCMSYHIAVDTYEKKD